MESENTVQPEEARNNDFDTGNFFPSLIETIKGVIAKPADFFKGMPTKAGFGPPIIFGMIMFAISGFLGGLIGSPTTNFYFGGQGTATPGGIGPAFQGLFGGAIGFLIVSWIAAGILHLFCLLFTGGAKGGFEATYRVGSYSSATSLATWIPIIGFFAGVYQLYLLIVGVREVHETTTGKAAAAVLVPFAILVVVVILAIIAFAAAFVGVMGGLGGNGGGSQQLPF